MGIDARKIHCVYTKWLEGAVCCVGNSIHELLDKIAANHVVTVTASQDTDFPFKVGRDKVYRYCYLMVRGKREAQKYTFKCPYCLKVVNRKRIHGSNGKIRCDYCHVTAPAKEWEEI